MSADDHLDPRLVRLIKKSEEDRGIFLREVTSDQLVEIYTRNSVYTLAVIGWQEGMVVVNSDGKHITSPEICYLSGSTFGGSMIKVRWIGIGMHLELWRPKLKRVLTTGPIQTIKLRKDHQKVQDLVKAAKRNR